MTNGKDIPTKEEDEIEFSGQVNPFKIILFKHFERITVLSSVELRGGYYTTTTTKTGEEKEIYVQDTREALGNAIYCLAQILITKFDDGMSAAFEKFQKGIKELRDKFVKQTKMEETEVLGEAYYEEENKISLEEYKIKKLIRYKELFTELSKLMGRKKWFEIGGAVF